MLNRNPITFFCYILFSMSLLLVSVIFSGLILVLFIDFIERYNYYTIPNNQIFPLAL